MKEVTLKTTLIVMGQPTVAIPIVEKKNGGMKKKEMSWSVEVCITTWHLNCPEN